MLKNAKISVLNQNRLQTQQIAVTFHTIISWYFKKHLDINVFIRFKFNICGLIRHIKLQKLCLKKKKRFSIFKFEAWRFTKLCLFQIRALIFYEIFSLEIPCTY